MARGKAKTNGAGSGSNTAMSQDDLDALALHHLTRLRGQEGKVAEAKSTYDAARAVLTDLFREAKVDGFTRKELAEILLDGRARHRNLAEEERRRAWLRSIAGLPVGAQLDLFTATPLEVRDEHFWRADGYQGGCRGEEAKPPAECPTRFTQAWMEGWNDGQAHLGKKLERAGEIIANRKPNPAQAPVDLNGREDEGADLSPETIDKAARKLKKAGFTAKAEPEAVH